MIPIPKKLSFFLTFLLVLTMPAQVTFSQSTDKFSGYVSCEGSPTRCILVGDKNTLQENRFTLVNSDGNKPFSDNSYDKTFVNIYGIHEAKTIRVYGISLSIPNEKIMQTKMSSTLP